MSFWEKFKEDFKDAYEEGKDKYSFENQAKLAEEKRMAKKEEKKAEKERIRQMDKEGIPYCPKCKSKSVQYVERRKQFSLGRGIVGGALAGDLGGAVGSRSSKKYKGFIKCLNCGNQWKK